MPVRTRSHCSRRGCPEDTTPQEKAHMGGNQVIGLSNSSKAEPSGRFATGAEREG